MLYLSTSFTISAQTELTSIPLDKSLGSQIEIMQFSADQGRTLLKFRGKKFCQYSLIMEGKLSQSNTIALGPEHLFLDCIWDENGFNLFYRNKKNRRINLYKIGNQVSGNKLIATNIETTGEKYLANLFYQGGFSVFKYSKSPFSLHEYNYEDGQYFEKSSQSFNNDKSEQFFHGQIRTADEVIFVRLALNNPYALHFYRYFENRGFEKKSIDIRAIYEKAGFQTKVFPSVNNLDASAVLSASVLGNDIYLDMEQLVDINPSMSKAVNLKQYPGILRLNWEQGNSEIISFDKDNRTDFVNRSIALSGKYYFKLLVSKNYLDLSIYEVGNQKLLENYVYNKDQDIDLIYEDARLTKTTNINLDMGSGVSIPLGIDHSKEEIIDTKVLLKNLSAEGLFLDVYQDENLIELRATGINQKAIILDRTLTASFVSYLSKSDLSIIKDLSDLDDPKWISVDDYIFNLTEKNNDIGNIIVYEQQGDIHVAYIDKQQRLCKIIAF